MQKLPLFLIGFLLIGAVTFSSCDDTGITPEKESFTISGTGIGDTAYNFTIKAMANNDSSHGGLYPLAEGVISSDNSFSLTVGEPPAALLVSLSQSLWAYMLYHDVNISDTSVKIIGDLAIGYFLPDGRQNGHVQKCNFYQFQPYEAGWKSEHYLYADKPVKFTGTVTYITESDTNITSIDLNFKKGWNTFTSAIDEFRPFTYWKRSMVSGGFPEGRWQFFGPYHP